MKELEEDEKDTDVAFNYKEILGIIIVAYKEIIIKVMPILISILLLSILFRLFLL